MAHKSQETQTLIIRANYHLRWGLLVLAALMILLGAAMVFLVPNGSPFGWSVHIPYSSANITNASSGIAFATMGMFLALATLTRKIA